MSYFSRIMVIAVLLVFCASHAEPKAPAEKNILLLYSFTINFAPDFQLVSTFNSTLSKSDIKLRVKHLELNAFAPEDATLKALSAKLAPLLPDIRNGKYDVIIPLGQTAIDLLHRHSADIPQQTSIAFCGLDIASKDLVLSHPNTTGALGRVSVADNIELGLHFYPNTKRIILLTNWSVQGKRILDAGRRYEETYPGIEYIYPDNASTSLNDLLDLIQAQNSNTLVLFYSWYNRDSTNLVSLRYMMTRLEHSAAPVFALQEPMLWSGAVGGIYTEIEPIGIALANHVEAILRGKKASDLTIAALPLKTVVNWSAVKNGRIAKSKIPVAAEVVGGNTIFKKENYSLLVVTGVSLLIFACLLTLISILFFRLRHITRRTDAVLRHIPGGIIVSDPEERLLFLHAGDMNCDNSSANLRLGALPCFYNEKIRQVIRQVFKTGKPQRFEHQISGRQYSVEVVKFSADIFGVDAVLWAFTDIDELCRARRLLNEALHKSRLTLDSVADAVIVTDGNARITYLNPAACTMLGCCLRTISGRLVEECFTLHPEYDSIEKSNYPLAEAIRNEISATQVYDYILRVPDRKSRNVIFNLSPITPENGSPIGSVLTIRDITPLKEYQNKLVASMQEAQNANRVKSSFLATMSHELRTPLNAVIGFSEVLQQNTLTQEERTEYLKSIRFAGTTLLNLINDILDLSKIEADQLVLTSRPANVNTLCREIMGIFKPAADKKGIFIKVDAPDNLPQLMLDEMRLRQILLNLVGNAVKFTSEGGVTIKIEINIERTNFANLIIHVMDTGIGIRTEAQKRIFEPFVQQDAERDSRVFMGTGLGLAISNRLAQYMDGTIKLKSEEGKGSDFTLTLSQVPLCPDDTAFPLEQPVPVVAISPNVCSLLIVDDVPLNLHVLQALLKKLGWNSTAASSAKEALAIMHRECPDVVLTDLWMPDINGREFARRIRSTPEFSQVRIFAVTADTEMAKHNPLEEFDGVIYKPLSQEKLQKFLHTLAKDYEQSNKS